MPSRRLQYALVNAAVLTASIIQIFRHRPPIVIVIAGLTFLFVGNLTIYIGGSKQRAIERQRKIDYYNN